MSWYDGPVRKLSSIVAASVAFLGGCFLYANLDDASSASGTIDAGSEASVDASDASASSDASAADVVTTQDAAGLRGPRCGATRCAPGDTCCYGTASNMGVCRPPGTCQTNEIPFRCTESESCAAAGKLDEVCCAVMSTTNILQTYCFKSPTCAGTEEHLCDPDAVRNGCSGLGACAPLAKYPDGYFACR